ncbi:MAG: hypothetical protein ACK56I_17300, partial [bacterium]
AGSRRGTPNVPRAKRGARSLRAVPAITPSPAPITPRRRISNKGPLQGEPAERGGRLFVTRPLGRKRATRR